MPISWAMGGDRPPGLDTDPLDQGQSSRRGQPGVSVAMRPPMSAVPSIARTSLGGLTSHQQPLWAEHLGRVS
jgi:hypothetical protein